MILSMRIQISLPAVQICLQKTDLPTIAVLLIRIQLVSDIANRTTTFYRKNQVYMHSVILPHSTHYPPLSTPPSFFLARYSPAWYHHKVIILGELWMVIPPFCNKQDRVYVCGIQIFNQLAVNCQEFREMRRLQGIPESYIYKGESIRGKISLCLLHVLYYAF